MKHPLLSAVFLTLSGTIALADVGAGLIGNTVTLTGPDGVSTQIFYSDANTILVKIPDGTEVPGTWRVDGNKICTTTGTMPENCTDPIDEPPAAGSSGAIDGEGGTVTWSIAAGKGF